MGRKIKHSDWSYRVTEIANTVRLNGEHGYLEGVIITPLGMVWVYSEGAGPQFDTGETTLNCVCGGVSHHRTINREYTKIGLARIANKFIKEVTDAT